ncbi:MAG: hypothetical protein GY841_10210 [FCB group bacterium]|nr:hypothetical protein [FCB group bacterium]
MTDNALRAAYAELRAGGLSIRDAAARLNAHWPDGEPWSSSSWYEWARGNVKMKHPARVAFHRYLGLDDPALRVYIEGVGDVEILVYSERPRAAVVFGAETEGVTLRQNALSYSMNATETILPRVNVRQVDDNVKRRRRQNLTFSDLGLVARLSVIRARLGCTWNELLKIIVEKLEAVQ